MQHESATYDEGAHAFYGIRILNSHSEKLILRDSSKMPVTVLNVLPAALREFTRFPETADNHFDPKFTMKDLELSRYATIFFSLLFGFYVFQWAKELYGEAAGIFSFFLYTFCPNLIAHSQLVTTDLYATGTMLMASYYFWKFLEEGGRLRAILSASTLGLAQISKYTNLYLYPIYLVIAVLRFAPNSYKEFKEKDYEGLRRRLISFFKYFSFFVGINLLIINAGFLFSETGLSLNKYRFESGLLRTVQSTLQPLGGLPILLPKPYVQGIDWVSADERSGKSFGNIYLLGQLQRKGTQAFKGFKDYYLVACFFKVPIAIQVFLFMSVIFYLRNLKKYNFLQREIFIFMPILFLTIYLNFFSRAQTGIRYILPTFPLLFIFCGSLLEDWTRLSSKFKIALTTLSLYLILSVLSYFPHYLAYFNEWVPDRKKAYKILADSNLDWGQSKWYLQNYLKAHPGTIVSPKAPTAGRIALSVNELVGVFSPERYRWLRENFEPVGHIAYSYLIYDIKRDQLEKLKISNGVGGFK